MAAVRRIVSRKMCNESPRAGLRPLTHQGFPDTFQSIQSIWRNYVPVTGVSIVRVSLREALGRIVRATPALENGKLVKPAHCIYPHVNCATLTRYCLFAMGLGFFAMGQVPRAAIAQQPPAKDAAPSPQNATKTDAAKSQVNAKAKTDDLKSKSAPTKTIVPKPTRPKKAVLRQELIDKPGAPRLQIEKSFAHKPLNFVSPSPQDQEAFEGMRRGEQVNRSVVDRVAKSLVYRMTEANREARLRSDADEILKIIQQTKQGSGSATPDFIRIFKQSIVRYLKDLLSNSMAVRVNALVLLRRLFDGNNDPHDGVVLAISVLNDAAQPEFCYFLALKVLDEAALHLAVQVEDEREAVNAILKIAAGKDVQELMIEQIAVSLGRMGRAFQGNLPERAEVGTFLANLSLNEKRAARTRFEAAVALARLKVQNAVRNWNFDLEALVVARSIRETLQASKDAKLSSESTRWRVLQMATALQDRLKNGATSEGYRSFLLLAAPMMEQILSDPTSDVDLVSLDRWLTSHEPPKNRRLAPQADEITYPQRMAESPPAAAGKDAAAKASAKENNGSSN